LPFASNGRFVAVTGSLGFERLIVLFRPSMIALLRVEHVDSQLNLTAAANPDIASDRQIQHAAETAPQVVVA
jgi:uncharacterized protein (DUF2252 family)